MSIIVAYPRPGQVVPARFFIAQGVYQFPKRVVVVLTAKNNQDLMYTGTPFGDDPSKYWRRAFANVNPGRYDIRFFDALNRSIELEHEVRMRLTSVPQNGPPTIDYPLPNPPPEAPYPLGPNKEFTAFGSTAASAIQNPFCRCVAPHNYNMPSPPTVVNQSWTVDFRGNPNEPENPHTVHVEDNNGLADSAPVHFITAVVGGNGPIMMKSSAPARSSGKKRGARKSGVSKSSASKKRKSRGRSA
ncbi:MAG: hypothetical protein L0Y72_29565 [Gemmataceae bacterium]|nr:hypothetical protein [Gemmataceae bacterium]MCI0743195.1 hypothetical protein [Gemmataceae bacterium]